MAIKFQYSADIPTASLFADLKVKGSQVFETDVFILFFSKKSFSSLVNEICCLKYG